MERPFSIIGFTMFASLIFIGSLGYKLAIVLLALSLFCLPIFFGIKKIRKGKVFIVVLLSVVLSSGLYLGFYFLNYAPQVSLCDKNLKISGTICEVPEISGEKYQYIIKTQKINGENVKGNYKVLYTSAEKLNADIYDELSISGETYQLGASNIPSKLNYMSDGEIIGMSPYSDVSVKHIKDKKGLNYLILKYRQRLIENIKSVMPSSNAGIAIGVLLGDKSYISSQNLDNIYTVGISHLVCVSGLHLSIWGFAILSLMRKLKFSRKSRHILALIFVVFFMALCGFTRSVMRAGIMFIVFLIAEIISADEDSLNSLGLSAFLILLNPFNAGNIGFIFSFLSTLSIITLGKFSLEKFKSLFGDEKPKGMRKSLISIAEIIIISLCVSVVCLPASIIIFKKIIVVSIIANVLILPFASVLLVSSGITALLSGALNITGIIAYPSAFISSYFSKYIIDVSAFLSKLKFVSIDASRAYFLIFLSILAVFASVFILMNKRRKQVLAYGSVILIVSLVIMSVCDTEIRKSECVITPFAMGQNICVSVECEDKFVLINSPTCSYSEEKISKAVNSSVSGKIDYLLLTSAKTKEGANYIGTLSSQKVNNVFVPDDGTFVLDGIDSEITYSNYYSLRPCTDLKITYITGEASAVLIEYKSEKILLLTNSSADILSLPKEMQDYNYLILNGKPNNNVVNSKVDGIIEIANEGKYGEINSSLLTSGYNVYETGKTKDLFIKIRNSKTTIGRKTVWQ